MTSYEGIVQCIALPSGKMAFGSETSFKSYIEGSREDSLDLMSFDGIETKGQSDKSDKNRSMIELEGHVTDRVSTNNSNHDNGEMKFNDGSAPTQRNNTDLGIEEVQPVDNMSSVDANVSDRLCGFLNKYKVGARGLGRNFKKRWFVFVDSSCKLLYFRTPQDIVPLGEIDVSNASFSIEIPEDGSHASGKDNVFEIRWVDLKTFVICICRVCKINISFHESLI